MSVGMHKGKQPGFKGESMKYIGDRKFYKNVAKITLPIIMQNGFTFMVSFIDNIMVGKIGTEALSSVAIVNQLIFVFNVSILGIIAGASIFGAQFHGCKDFEGVKETFRFRLTACILVSAIALLLLLCKGESFILLFLHSQNGSAETAHALLMGKEYLNIILIGLLPSAITQVYASTQRDIGKTFLPMCASVTAVLLNTALNYILIFGKLGCPALGVKGAAIATTIARFAECIIIVAATHIKSDDYYFAKSVFRPFRLSPLLARKMLLKGSPLMINEMFWSLGTVIVMQCYSIRGIQVVASINIATTIYNIFSVLYIALGGSIAIIIGQLLGAGKMEEAKDTDRKLIFLAIASSIVMAAVIILSAPVYLQIYNTTEDVREMAISFMYILAILMPVSAYIHAAFFTIRAGGNTMVTFLFDSSNLWLVNIPLAFCLTRYSSLPIVSVYFICQSADIIKCTVGFILVKKGIWLKKIVPDK